MHDRHDQTRGHTAHDAAGGEAARGVGHRKGQSSGAAPTKSRTAPKLDHGIPGRDPGVLADEAGRSHTRWCAGSMASRWDQPTTRRAALEPGRARYGRAPNL